MRLPLARSLDLPLNTCGKLHTKLYRPQAIRLSLTPVPVPVPIPSPSVSSSGLWVGCGFRLWAYPKRALALTTLHDAGLAQVRVGVSVRVGESLSHGPDFKIGHIQWPVSWHFYARKMSTSLQNATYSTLQPVPLPPTSYLPVLPRCAPSCSVCLPVPRLSTVGNVLFTTSATSSSSSRPVAAAQLAAMATASSSSS